MKYSAIRNDIRTGDVLLCKDRTFSGIFIRALTAGGYNHIAVFVWLQDNDLWLAEMTGKGGYKLTRASQYLAERDSQMRWGKYPKEFRPDHPETMRKVILSAKGEPYGWFSLVKVWWSQIINKDVEVMNRVCSTFAQMVWASIGIEFKRTADPDDIEGMCPETTLISA